MQPIVILDTNALYGRKPFTQANTELLLELSELGYVRLIVPQVVLLELSRHWDEKLQQTVARVNSQTKKLNEALTDIRVAPVELHLPSLGRKDFYDYAENLFRSKNAEIPLPPDMDTQDLLLKDIEVRKPFTREGKGFRDALIWETIRDLCSTLGNTDMPILFVTNNHADFCDKKERNLHSDLQRDLDEGQIVDIVASLYDMKEHDAIAPLVEKLRVPGVIFTPEVLEKRIEDATSALSGVDVAEILDTYVGQGMYESPISVGLENPAFEEIYIQKDTISSETIRSGDQQTIHVTVEAECSIGGFLLKSGYFAFDEDVKYFGLEDWNDHYFKASVYEMMRFTFSSSFTEDSIDNVELSLDDAQQL